MGVCILYYQVNDANVERVRFLVFEERNSAPDIGVGPLVWVGIRNVQASHCGRINFLCKHAVNWRGLFV